MKMILKCNMIILAAMSAINSYAIDGDFLLNVKKGKANQISFSVNEIPKAKVTIYDSEHNEIYSEVVTGNGGISRTYNLDEFPDGVYFLEVKTELKRVTHEILINGLASTLSRKSVAEIYKGGVKSKNQSVASLN